MHKTKHKDNCFNNYYFGAAYGKEYIPKELASLPEHHRGCLFQLIWPRLKNNIIAEFGVSKGISTRKLSSLADENAKIYLFDSWLGLPEEWDLGGGQIDPVGAYKADKWSTTDQRLIFCDGLFKDSLPFAFPEQVGLVHIDCDIYSSTRDALFGADEYILDGTIVVFDEIWGYRNYKNHEYKACKEWELETGKRIEWLLRDNQFAACGIVRC